jgi:hypothetical protein
VSTTKPDAGCETTERREASHASKSDWPGGFLNDWCSALSKCYKRMRWLDAVLSMHKYTAKLSLPKGKTCTKPRAGPGKEIRPAVSCEIHAACTWRL